MANNGQDRNEYNDSGWKLTGTDHLADLSVNKSTISTMILKK